jgi:hypothetical protein
MRPLILCYSKTGHTRALARRLAEAIGDADLAEIGCARYAQGGARVYMRAGFDALRGARPEIEMPPSADGRELVLIGSPVWVGRPAAPLVSYLARRPKLPARVGLFLTSGGGPPQTGAVERIQALLPAPAAARLVLSQNEVTNNAADDRIADFVAALTV